MDELLAEISPPWPNILASKIATAIIQMSGILKPKRGGSCFYHLALKRKPVISQLNAFDPISLAQYFMGLDTLCGC